MISPETKQQYTALLQMGCTQQTAAAFCGLNSREAGDGLQSDATWRRNVERAEASCEVGHIRNLQQASQDPKNWRISQWWLESRWPERYARKADTITNDQLTLFVENIAQVLFDEIPIESDRQRVFDRLAELISQQEISAERGTTE